MVIQAWPPGAQQEAGEEQRFPLQQVAGLQGWQVNTWSCQQLSCHPLIVQQPYCHPLIVQQLSYHPLIVQQLSCHPLIVLQLSCHPVIVQIFTTDQV